MFGLLVILFTVVPAIEIFLLFKIGGEIGGFNTMLVVLATGVLGASLAKSQGMQILMRMQNDMGKGSIPGNQIIHGLMVFAGGLLLLTPGFMTDIFGFSLVMPGPRHILIIWVRKLIENAMKSGNINFSKFSGPQGFAGGGFSTNSHQGFEQDTDSSTLFETGSFSEDSMSDKQQTAKKSSVIEGDIIEAEFTRKNDE